MSVDARVSLVSPALYVPRIRVYGTIHWICPYSAHYNVTRLSQSYFRMSCSTGQCGHRFIPGFVMYPIARGRGGQSIPPDWVIPSDYELDGGLREAFPAGDLATVPWRRHEPTHVLVDPASSSFNAGLFVKMARRIAQIGQGEDFAVPATIGAPPQSAQSTIDLARLGAAFQIAAHQIGL
jgi:hypothetical protein